MMYISHYGYALLGAVVAVLPLWAVGHWLLGLGAIALVVLFIVQYQLSGMHRLTGEDFFRMHPIKSAEYEERNMCSVPPAANKEVKEDLANGITLEVLLAAIQRNCPA